jgi:hypothetical protein
MWPYRFWRETPNILNWHIAHLLTPDIRVPHVSADGNKYVDLMIRTVYGIKLGPQTIYGTKLGHLPIIHRIDDFSPLSREMKLLFFLWQHRCFLYGKLYIT